LKNDALLYLSALVFFAGCGPQPVANRDSRGTVIVCFGDSLTAGTGAEPGEDYPSILRAKVGLPVINAGIQGDTTAAALERLDRDVLRRDPKIVIITLGGNDFLLKLPRDETLKNMAAIVDRSQAKGAMVVWAAVKAGLFGDAYGDDLKKLAHQKRFLLIPDILKGIFFEPKYKSDQIHPNAEGYKIMAERIYGKIRPLLEEEAGKN
jgi:lysophospholipase L1-like esterase